MPISKGVTVFAILFAVDRFTKIAALYFFTDSVTLNTKAFGVFDQAVIPLLFFGALVILIALWFARERSFASAIIFAGALGNAFDRLRYGAVIDWLTIPGLTVLNVADIYIVIGCALVILKGYAVKSMFRKRCRP